MTTARKEQRDEWNALAYVRLAIRGWAFAAFDKLPGYVAKAEAEVAKLDEKYRQAGDDMVKPLRSTIEKGE